ncbi:MAG: DUF427 domain-containing protein [Chloroflexi bacterium]|nr:MAG: DUF427 domain-containing protein [Chloroflexota bacterium]
MAKTLIEPSPRWVRVQFNGEFVANSKRVLLVKEAGRIPVYYFPREDVRMDCLEPTGRGHEGRETFHVRVGERVAENGAWSYVDPAPELSQLKGYVAFRWRKMDHWFEEEEEVFVHARDPYHRVDTLPSSRHVRVVVDGVTVADTKRPFLLFETGLPTRYYIHPDDIRMDLLEPTDTQTQCPYKGVASYWSVKIGDKIYKDIVWGYMDPIPECPKIKGLLCFYNEKVDIYVDGELQERPQTPWS